MIIKVVLFAAAREAIGKSTVELELGEPCNVAAVKAKLLELYPELETILATSSFAVDHEFATMETEIKRDVELGVIPPVSGG